jgi:hypothetical protein
MAMERDNPKLVAAAWRFCLVASALKSEIKELPKFVDDPAVPSDDRLRSMARAINERVDALIEVARVFKYMSLTGGVDVEELQTFTEELEIIRETQPPPGRLQFFAARDYVYLARTLARGFALVPAIDEMIEWAEVVAEDFGLRTNDRRENLDSKLREKSKQSSDWRSALLARMAAEKAPLRSIEMAKIVLDKPNLWARDIAHKLNISDNGVSRLAKPLRKYGLTNHGGGSGYFFPEPPATD